MEEFEFEFTGSTYTLKKYSGSAPKVCIPSSYNGKKVTAIGPYAFFFNETLKGVTIPSTVTRIEKYAFKNSAIESITIPDWVTFVGYGAFDCCFSLTSVKLPDNLKVIEGETFNGCSKLVDISIPKTVTHIGLNAFGYCSSLEKVTIPSSVTVIEEDAFRCCSGLKRAVFEHPDGWYLAYRMEDDYGDDLSGEDLEHPPTAAKMLKNRFVYGNIWKRR